MAKSRNWDELQYVWTEWRRRSGMRIKDLYQQLVTLNNEAAKLNSMIENHTYNLLLTYCIECRDFQSFDKFIPLFLCSSPVDFIIIRISNCFLCSIDSYHDFRIYLLDKCG